MYLAKRQKELLLLKCILSEFLFYRQLTHGIDKRYDAFFATLLELTANEKLALPNKIKILSWNYDKQIEYSIAQFNDITDSEFIEEFIQIVPNKNGVKNINVEKFSLFKLNGSVGGSITMQGRYSPLRMDYKINYELADNELNENIFKTMLSRYLSVKERILLLGSYDIKEQNEFPTILYSWEKQAVFEETRNHALHVIKNTNILTIIGYSFPTFNRKFDKEILNSMDQLKIIYLQSPKESIDGVMQRLKSIISREVDIVPITNTEEFYIPFQY